MSKRLSKTDTSGKVRKALVALRTLVRRTRPAPAKSVRRVSAAAPLPPAISSFTPERVRDLAAALRVHGTPPVQAPGAALPIRSHMAAEPSAHLLEVALPGATEQTREASVRGSFFARTVEHWTSGTFASPRRMDAERRLNPHRADDRRPEALASRVAAHAEIPAALLRGASEVAEEGAARLARPFERVWNTLGGDRIQPLMPYAAGPAHVGEDVEWELPEGMDPPASPVSPSEIRPSPDAESARFSGWFPFALSPGWQRSFAAFIVVALLAIAPVHLSGAYAAARHFIADVRLRGTAAVDAVGNVGHAAATRDLSSTAAALAAANAAFGDVRSALGPLGGALMAVAEQLPGGSARTGATLLAAGDTLTRAGEEFAARLSALSSDAPPTEVLAALRETVARLGPDISRAAEAIASVNPEDIPAEHRAEVAALAGSAQGIRQAFTDFLPLADAVQGLLGADTPRRYLLVFQNQNELRPTGGFIGSFAEVTLSQGRMTDMRVPPGGSYDIQGDVRAWLNPPDPLRLVAGRWRFHDANWFPDFPTSARKLAWFYEKSGGPTVDGVIAVNATVLSDLLAVTGPVPMPAYGVTLTSENVLDEVQRTVELSPTDPQKPKQILTDLFPILLARVQSPTPQMSLALADLVGHALRTRSIQISVNDPAAAATFARFGWDGALKSTDGDYLDVVATNIGGEKTDAVIRDDIMHEVAIGNDGRVTDTVTITRTHRGQAGTPLTGTGNITYLRLYVPQGAVLLSADGDFEPPRANLFIPKDDRYQDDPAISAALADTVVDRVSGTAVSDESGKTVFANWMQLLPGESKTVRFRYELPMRVAVPRDASDWQRTLGAIVGAPARGTYTLLLQKQSGAEERYVTVRVRPPQGMRTLAAVPDEIRVTPEDGRMDVWHQTADRFIGVIFGN